jgi:hypothetical protein
MKIRRLFLVSFLIMAVSMLTGWKRHHKKHKIKMPVATQEDTTPKKLDLSLPFKINDKFDTKTTQTKSDSLIEKPKKIQRKVELEADTIVFPYAEAEKMQSVDGAAITINVKP